MSISEKILWEPKWTIQKYGNRQDYKNNNVVEIINIEGNLLLNEGITELLNLLIGATATVFNNSNAKIGVGDSNTVAASDQTALQAVTNKLYKAMDATYPQISNQTVTFRSTFAESEANFAWNEITVANGSNETTAKNLNRKVQSIGTKADPGVWVVTLEITVS